MKEIRREGSRKKKKELRYFMARRITHLQKEQEDQLKLLRTRDLDVEVERTQEDVKHLSVHESRAPTPEREEVSPLNLMKDHRQREVTFPREGKNQNWKRIPVTQITGKKARKLSKKKTKLEKL
jgi:hypothetical protein